MQSLSGKLAALNRFLAKSAERSLPFFNTLKNITKENKHEYRWTQEAEEAFQQMKKLITDLPTLTPPREKETLYAYLAVSAEAVSAVLLTDRKGMQYTVQYVSMTLNEAERNYDPMEKLALSLIHMTKRLRRKLAKYVVKLGAYNITFMPRNAVKGQVLADFLSEAPEGEKEEILKGSGAGLVLIGPSGIKYTYALRLTFPSTNNEAEYEALLAGLRIARQMNISNIEVKVDSKLVASQINESYEASKDNMIKYLAKAKEYASGFKSFSIENIPRNMNQKADVLSKLASVAFNHLTKEVLVEVLNERSMEGQEIHTIVEEEGDNWMTPIVRCLEEGVWPKDKNKARCLRAKIGQYAIESGIIFKKGYLVVVRKAIRQGYYWPTMHEDAKEEVQKCESNQIHASMPRLPKTLMTSIMAPWPKAVILAEIGIPTYRTLMVREEYNVKEMRLNLDLLQERRETTAIREARYKSKMEQYYNKKVRPASFKPGEFMFRRNEASRVEDQGKPGPKWKGPYRVMEVYENGSYKLQTLEDKE
ncbi:reverse transcriptase domain-containing protein, partial [Tanacetum coccineum]